MDLNSLQKIKTKKSRRLGRGHGSGRGKTSGRGTKGQKARRDISLFFEGGALPLIKRLPLRRGKDRNNVFKKKPLPVNIKILNLFAANSTVDLDSLIKNKIIKADEAKQYGVKILGEGEVKVPLVIKVKISNAAKVKIEKAGGKVEI